MTNVTFFIIMKFNKFTDTEIGAALSGQKVESFGEDIKAATYHGLDIRQGKDGLWEASCYLTFNLKCAKIYRFFYRKGQ